MAKVVFEKIYKSYPSRKQTTRGDTNKSEPTKSEPTSVLKNINLTVEDGEFVVLVGPSGCGKSTLLRMLAGLESVTGGNIFIGDRSVNSLPPKARDIAMVFQNYALYPHLNIYDNLAFGLRRANVEENVKSSFFEDLLASISRSFPGSWRYFSEKEKKIRDRVRYVASLLQIEALLYRLPKELSGGQKQRVALGRAIARNPQVFLMDEPLSNLDAKLRNQTRAQIVQLQRKLGTTTIYVTHDQTEAMTMGDRIAVMNEGQIQQMAAPLEIYEKPANRFVAEFIGSPAMNFLPVDLVDPLTLVGDRFRLQVPEFLVQPLKACGDNTFTLGVRPQHLHLGAKDPSNILVEVDLIEALGNETYLTTHLAKNTNAVLIVSLPGNTSVAVGDLIWLAVERDKIHLFTVDEGRSIVA